MDAFLGLLLMTVLAAIYFVPTIIVIARKDHPQAMPIIMINVFAGWTLIGWVGALAWSLASFQRPSVPTPQA